MTKKYLLFLAFTFCCSTGFAQQLYSISGSVKDKKETLPGAAIYVSGYKIATVTNNEGKFVLPKLAAGNYDILVQMIGYLPYSKNIVVTDKSVYLDVLLTENATTLSEVVIKPDPNRAYNLAMFKDFFIGKTPNAEQCKILNTHVLTFDDDAQTSTLSARASEFLVIENKALGYRIKYLLEYFEYNYRTKIIYFAGHTSFEELKGGNAKQKRWLKNREIAYNGSIQHFFKSLYQNKVAENGFAINKLKTIPNPGRKPDSLIAANIKRLTFGKKATNVLTFNGGDSLSYWLNQRNEPKEISLLLRADVLVDTLVRIFNSDLKTMNYTDALYIIYKNEREPESFASSGLKQNRTMDLENYQISVVNLIEPPVTFYANGGVFNPRSLLFRGFWAYEKVADMVPMDYLSAPKK